MTKKIFRAVFVTAVITLFVTFAVTVLTMYGYFLSLQTQQLKSQLALAVRGVENEGEEYLHKITGCRLTLIASDGKVLYDTEADAASMENHSGREEVREALSNGSGQSTRVSPTLMENTMYLAERLHDNTVLRISESYSSEASMMVGALRPIAVIFLAAALFSIFLARKMSKRIVEPLGSLNLEKPLDNEAYDERSPILSHMEHQRRRIKKQTAELEKSRGELAAVIQNMNEGLVLLDANKNILAINNAAASLFNTEPSCIGKPLITIERGYDIIKAAESTDDGKNSEICISRGGREYQLNISPIGEKTVILAFDITDRVFAERNRREFTANVSHELKTPLQSIIGSAELLESGLVKQEDKPRFTANIHSEAARLVTLIDDIIRLSQLDEKNQMDFENVDLYLTAADVVSELSAAAKKRGVTINLTGQRTVISGVPRLVHELIYNLCDNAIRYNKENGSVDISVSASEDGARLVVSDTGIGIPIEHQSRVFERFYRVDKSHSKETGGTGLGLSIVKHAAEDLGAKLTLKSEPGQGTEIGVTFKIGENR